MAMKNKTCILCKEIYIPLGRRQFYCPTCRKSGKARKAISHKYIISEKGRRNQKRWYYRDIARARKSKRKWNNSKKGKIIKNKWYQDNKQRVNAYILTKYRKQIIARTTAKRRVRRLGWQKICAKCGSEKIIHLHHKDGNAINGSIDNLIYLCRNCHREEHIERRLHQALAQSSDK